MARERRKRIPLSVDGRVLQPYSVPDKRLAADVAMYLKSDYTHWRRIYGRSYDMDSRSLLGLLAEKVVILGDGLVRRQAVLNLLVDQWAPFEIEDEDTLITRARRSIDDSFERNWITEWEAPPGASKKPTIWTGMTESQWSKLVIACGRSAERPLNSFDFRKGAGRVRQP